MNRDLKGLDRLPGRTMDKRAGRKVEAASVPGASHSFAYQLALIQRAAFVRALRLGRIESSSEIIDSHALPIQMNKIGLAGSNIG